MKGEHESVHENERREKLQHEDWKEKLGIKQNNFQISTKP